jgi:hypothetical protein
MRLKPFFAAVAVVGALAFNASALIVGPGSPVVTGDDNSNLSDAQITSLLSSYSVGPLSAVYQQLLNGAESGSHAGSYTTTFANSPTEPQDADISFDGGLNLSGFSDLWLYVKDGTSRPAYYLIDLKTLGWDGESALQLRGFWPNDGSITQVRILGNSSAVPDGGVTVALLAAGLSGLGMVRRFINR